VVLAISALEFEVIALAFVAHGDELPSSLEVIFPFAALLSFALIAWSYLGRLREKWLLNLFVRERIRQWRHQLLLDGDLVQECAQNDDKANASYHEQWSKLNEIFEMADGKFQHFVGGSGEDDYFFTDRPAPPADPSLMSDVLACQESMRIQYQRNFSSARGTSGSRRISLQDFTRVIQWLASTTLVGAVLAATGVFVVRVVEYSNAHTSTTSLVLATIAIGLAVLSLGVRALRTGLTIPAEYVSFEEYRHRCNALGLWWDRERAKAEMYEQWQCLVEFERTSASELRRYLRMKASSRFIV
jgi:hypothetical protein